MILSNSYSIWIMALIMSLGFQGDNFLLSSQSSVAVNGTSTLHDWTMTMEEVDGQANFSLDETGKLIAKNVRVELQAEKLKSKHTQMDKITYKALKTNKHPNIIFSAEELVSTKINDANQTLSGKGKLSIAGVTKTINLKATCNVPTNGAITCRGSKNIKMTDYDIDPPTAMLGTIKTGDEITIAFSAEFSQIRQ